jgi:hypothetical protein
MPVDRCRRDDTDGTIVAHRRRHAQLTRLRGELRCIADKVADDLDQSIRVGDHAQPLARNVELQLLPPIANDGRMPGDSALDGLRNIDALALQLDVAAVDPRQIEQVVDELGEPRALALDDVLRSRRARIAVRGHPLQQLDRAADRRERIAQLVRERREKRALALLEIADRRRRLLALGDVDARADVAREAAIAVEARRAVVEKPPILPVVLRRSRYSRTNGTRLSNASANAACCGPKSWMQTAVQPSFVSRERAAGEFEPRDRFT